MSSTKIIYHEIKPGLSCPDGLAAAWVAQKVFPDAMLIGWQYQSEEIPVINTGDLVIIVDFSFPRSVLENWDLEGAEITVIDHHKTAQAMLEGFCSGILRFDMAKCGAVLTWEYFFPDKPIPVFLQYVQDQDLWNWELEGSEAVREAFAVLGRSFGLFDELQSMGQREFLDFMLPIGQPKLEGKQRKVEDIASRCHWLQMLGHHIPVVGLLPGEERWRSDVCAYLYKKYPEAPFSACFRVDESDQKHWDLRSNKNGNNFDVSGIATRFGGGGHRNAAGFRESRNDS